jgi:hypothetical protein
VFVANEDYYYLTVSCHRPLLPGTSTLETMAIPTARVSSSGCSAFCIMCDVPNLLNVYLPWLPNISLNILLLVSLILVLVLLTLF